MIQCPKCKRNLVAMRDIDDPKRKIDYWLCKTCKIGYHTDRLISCIYVAMIGTGKRIEYVSLSVQQSTDGVRNHDSISPSYP